MSDELRDLYQDLILDHGRKPRNFRVIDPADRKAQGHNPLCGDRCTVFVKLDGDKITDASFHGSGCAISQASASIMTQVVKGRSVEEAKDMFSAFHALVTGHPEQVPDSLDLGKLAAFAGVSEFPNRVKCASLAWHTLNSALENDNAVTSTE